MGPNNDTDTMVSTSYARNESAHNGKMLRDRNLTHCNESSCPRCRDGGRPDGKALQTSEQEQESIIKVQHDETDMLSKVATRWRRR